MTGPRTDEPPARPGTNPAIRIAMWSGPRNISTALMRSFGARADTVVVDEPLYAHYLQETGLEHPGRDEILATHDTDWMKVVVDLLSPIPPGRTVSYQKHMAHHLLPSVGRDWLGSLRHAFLIRDPGEMLASLSRVIPKPRLEDTGLPQQQEIFERVRGETGETPPVLDARDVLENPQAMLAALCERLGLAFDPAMLSWEPGTRATDGVWAKHWYEAVEASSGFGPPRPPGTVPPSDLAALHRECVGYHERLARHRLRV